MSSRLKRSERPGPSLHSIEVPGLPRKESGSPGMT